MGASYSKEFMIEENHLANKVGSGGLPVLSTPSMVAFMENTAWESVEKDLSNQETTVGTQMNVKHLAPSNQGKRIKVISELVERSKAKLTFELEAYVDGKLIGKASHKRAIIITEEFLRNI